MENLIEAVNANIRKTYSEALISVTTRSVKNTNDVGFISDVIFVHPETKKTQTSTWWFDYKGEYLTKVFN